MSDPKYLFQYCQKLVIFSSDKKKLFFARRTHEADYNGAFAFIGGKMETSDQSIIKGLKREKDEEIGNKAKIMVYPHSTFNALYTKKDGNKMILPHYLAYFVEGEIKLNPNEYSEYLWVPVGAVADLEPKVENVAKAVSWAAALSKSVGSKDLVEI